jgi:hypothetical protein
MKPTTDANDSEPQATSTPVQVPPTVPKVGPGPTDIDLHTGVADIDTQVTPPATMPDVHASPTVVIQQDTSLHAAVHGTSVEAVTTPLSAEVSGENSPVKSPDKALNSSDTASIHFTQKRKKKSKKKKPSEDKKKKPPKKKKSHKPGNHCLGAKCKHSGSADGDMLRCIFCYRWYHCDCTNSSVNEDGAWPCPGCRKMPGTISKLECQMQQVLELNNEIVRKCTQLLTELSSCQARNVAEKLKTTI